jgi:hypothetical protein
MYHQAIAVRDTSSTIQPLSGGLPLYEEDENDDYGLFH